MSEWVLETCVWSDTGIWIDSVRWSDDCTDPLGASRKQIVAFSVSLDGHEFYVLRLGERETLVYDLTTNTWASWDSPGRSVWRANSGTNWIGVLGSGDMGTMATNIVLGDDGFGTLWTLDPEAGYDEGPFDGDNNENFTRTVTGGIPIRGRPSPRCNAVDLTASVGDPGMTDTAIQLRYSDDNGRTWFSAGTVIVRPNVFSTELRWRSLGLMKAPGRIFEVIDTGATVRIDDAVARLDDRKE